MQAARVCSESLELMAEKNIESYIVQRIEAEQKKLGGQLDKLSEKIEERFLRFGTDIGEIKGSLSKQYPWWITNFAAPVAVALTVAAILGGLAGYIALSGRLSNI